MSDLILTLGDTSASRAPDEAQLLLHGHPRDRAALSALAGFDLSDTMLASTAGSGWHALHLSPDEWLLVGPNGGRGDMAARFAEAPIVLSLVDISDRSVGIDLTGPLADDLLAGGCPLDLATLSPGGCTRTLFGKVTVLLWRRDDGWRMSHARSYDAYVVDLLCAVAEDLASP
ncbi:sarcosine oxidase subunit gamma [Sphingomonas jinjuensis]|uniref:Sarcosine oxidase subunit gamma n=1 Tax=Sphingomonas jinjuensis TaxID=535907 RepID=A0A840FP44_9SPHN|nr:sarcosine oxidase subunit gamma [Sphingomonas jinjuensis]MBB4155658.1 sarcosine oxidase subunit gamma [Sphingomonas jinjuensis]